MTAKEDSEFWSDCKDGIVPKDCPLCGVKIDYDEEKKEEVRE